MDSYAAPTQHSTVPDVAPARWRVVIMCFLAILLDGFDTTSISFVVPTLAREWGVAPAAFTPAFITTSVGAVIGYLLSGRLTYRFGERQVILGSVLLFACGSLVTCFVGSISELALLRLVTGIGLGAVLPAAIATAANQFPVNRREVVAVAVAAGIGLGSTLGGVFGGGLIARHGWEAVFWLGGLLPLLLLPLMWWGLPAGAKRKTAEPNARFEAGIRSLFTNGLATGTVLLWAYSFLIFLALYALILWMPTLLLGYGFKPTETSIGTACIGVGGLAGVILLIPLSWRFGGSRVLVFASLLGAAAVACLGLVGLERGQLLLTIAVIGMGLQAGTVGQIALAVKLYPTATRTSGVGYAAAAGRIGSILGPAIGGMLLSLQMPPGQILLTACVPIAAAALAVGLLDFHGRRK